MVDPASTSSLGSRYKSTLICVYLSVILSPSIRLSYSHIIADFVRFLQHPNSLFLFAPNNIFRKGCLSTLLAVHFSVRINLYCLEMVQHRAFDIIVTIAILVGAVLLALEDPARKKNETFMKVVYLNRSLLVLKSQKDRMID